MVNPPILLIGGGHCRALIDVIEQTQNTSQYCWSASRNVLNFQMFDTFLICIGLFISLKALKIE